MLDNPMILQQIFDEYVYEHHNELPYSIINWEDEGCVFKNGEWVDEQDLATWKKRNGVRS